MSDALPDTGVGSRRVGKDKSRPGDVEDIADLAATLAGAAPQPGGSAERYLVNAVVEILTRKHGYLSGKELRNELQSASALGATATSAGP